VNEWVIAYEGFDPAQEGLREALCTLGNGAFATRGAAPESEADPVHYPGTYVAGCYDRLRSTVAGRRIENEDLVNVPNWLPLGFRLGGGPWFDAGTADLEGYEQRLDLRRGVLLRTFRVRDRRGRTTRVTQRRLVSMADPHMAAIETTFVAEDWSGSCRVRSALDGRVTNAGVARYRNLRGDHLVPRRSWVHGQTVGLAVETRDSRVRIAEAARTTVHGAGEPVPAKVEPIRERGYAGIDLVIHLPEGVPITVEKIVTLATSLDAAVYEPSTAARDAIAVAGTFEELMEAHALAWDQLWDRFDLRLDGDERTQTILRLHIFHLLQTVSSHTIDRDVGVPARGLHGEAYRGHIFWDELFIFPLLSFRTPTLTRSLIDYRYRRLPRARWRAASEGLEGASYPWQSGSDGREESQTYHLNPRSGRWMRDNSWLQRHINVAIAYNVWQYYEVTADRRFMRYRGGPMLIEIARLLASLTTYDRVRDRYEIRGVMGPDEFHDGYPDRGEPGLDNNAYTNVMSVWVLGRALAFLRRLPEHEHRDIWESLHLSLPELERWEDITRKMFVPFHDGVISQFEGYERLEELNWEDYFARYGDIHRLDRILESEDDTANRYKVSKQADVLMLFYLLSADELREIFARLGYELPPEMIPRTVEYYLARTSHGSTLSRVVQAWVLARSDRERSWQVFSQALESDVADVQGGTTSEGIHLGAMAGTVDLIQRCYTGLEIRDDVLRFAPALPAELTHLALDLGYRGHLVSVDLTPERLRATVAASDLPPIALALGDELVELAPGQTKEFALSG
jgi:trehalose/maltose hydrolase-like predicted phosphorylase